MRKRLTTILLGFAAVALASSVAGAATQVDLVDSSGLPGVIIQLGANQPVKLLLDTGNAVSILNLNDAKTLGLALEPYKGQDGQIVPKYFKTTVEHPTLGDQILAPITFRVVAPQKKIDGGSPPPAAGPLCYTDQKDRVITIDYTRH